MTVTRRITGHWLWGCRCRAANQRGDYECCRIVHSTPSYHFVITTWRTKEAEFEHMNRRKTAIAILTTLSAASLALADDFKTIEGKEYKGAKVTRVEPDGIVVKTKSAISKLYFAELPRDVQRRFNYDPLVVEDHGPFVGKCSKRVQVVAGYAGPSVQQYQRSSSSASN